MLERFLTDTLTNAVVLDDVRVLSSVTRLLEDGRPLRALLHEKTHHASFNGPVGLALAALNASGVFIEGDVKPDVFTLSQRDYLLGQSVYPFLEPLLEGLAVFAEFDGIPGPSPVASSVSATAARLLFGQKSAFDQLRDLMWMHRLSPEHTLAKRELLGLPLQTRPPYLMGYLAIKNLYFTLEARCKTLVDSDLFVLLMLDYWFYDRPLAQRLLAIDRCHPSMVGEDAAWVVSRFEDRLAQLVHNVEQYVAELVEWQLQAPETPTIAGAAGGASYRGAAAPDIHTLAVMRFGLAFGLFNYRTDFRFSSTELQVEVTSDRLARITTVAGELAGQDIPVVANADIGVFRGALEGVLTPALNGRTVMIISAGDGLVAVRDWGVDDWNPPELVQYFDDFPSALGIQNLQRYVRKRHAATAQLPTVSHNEPYLREWTRLAIEHVYPKIATLGCPREIRGVFLTGLAVDGLSGPLGGGQLLDTLATISARAGCHIWQFAADAAEHGWDESVVRNDADAINARLRPVLGSSPVNVQDGNVSSLV